MKSKTYDFVLVGAGISNAVLCAALSRIYPKILVLDCRNHLAGNCYDYPSRGSYVHQYGPHILHTNNQVVREFLSEYTAWSDYRHSVEAEIQFGDEKRRVPFPYSSLTEQAIGEELSPSQVVDLFFRGYSEKMWGKTWDKLPPGITSRVPQKAEGSDYFPGQFCALPAAGYSTMIQRMFSKADVVLGVDPRHWPQYLNRCGRLVYTGRLDHVSLQSFRPKTLLPYRSLLIQNTVAPAPWNAKAPVVNFCHTDCAFTRQTSYSRLTGGDSEIMAIEYPRPAGRSDVAPFYPDISEHTSEADYREMAAGLSSAEPRIKLLGRLGLYRYLDMSEAVRLALCMAQEFGFTY